MQKLILGSHRAVGNGANFLYFARAALAKYVHFAEKVKYVSSNGDIEYFTLYYNGEFMNENGEVLLQELHENSYVAENNYDPTTLTIF